MPDAPEVSRRRPMALLLAAAGVVALVAGLVVWRIGPHAALEEGRRLWLIVFDACAGAGPGVFFGAMAVLPCFGVPMSPFALSAGPLFSARLGTAAVLGAGIAAITFNLIVTYWLARRWLRPVLSRLVERLGHQLPEVERGDATDLIVLLRVTPGIPFFVQNYLLGLAEAPFGRYLAISCVVQWSFNVAFMLFGDALSQGRGRMAFFAIGLVAALATGTHLLRRHLSRRKAAA